MKRLIVVRMLGEGPREFAGNFKIEIDEKPERLVIWDTHEGRYALIVPWDKLDYVRVEEAKEDADISA